jgi:hypothetical protein
MALRDNLVSWWELNETSGTRVDSHGGNDLTDNNTVGSATGIQGNAADFENANNESLSNSSPTGFTLTNSADMSWSFWIKTESDVTNACLSSRWDAGNKGWLFRLNSSGFVECFLGDAGTTRSAGAGTTDVSDTNWHNVIITWNSSDDILRLYIDGNTTPELTSGALTISQSTTTFEIGDNETVGSAVTFDGLIDETGIWTKVLSSSEITDLYNSGSGLSYADTAAGSSIKEVNGLALASIKSWNGVILE